MPDPSLETTTITQIGIVVQDIEAKARAWATLFGVPAPEIIVTDPVEVAQTEYRGAATPARARLAFLQMGQVSVELIEPIDGPSTWRDQLDGHGDSLHHIAVEVHGLGEKLLYLAGNGIPLVQRGEYTGGRYAYADATAQLGAVLELLENDSVGP